MAEIIYHGTDAQYDGTPAGQWTWWTREIGRAQAYGDRIIEERRTLNVVRTDAENGEDFLADLSDAGVDVTGIADLYDDDLEIAAEPHQVITDRRQSALLADRVRAAGYDGIEHWEDHPVAGEGMVIAAIAE